MSAGRLVKKLALNADKGIKFVTTGRFDLRPPHFFSVYHLLVELSVQFVGIMLLDRTRIERVGMERKNWQEMSCWCQYLRPGSHYLLIYFRCGQIILPRRSTGYLYRVLWSLFHHSGLCCFLWPCWFSQTDR